MATLSERITTLRHSGYQTSEIAAILDVTPAEVHIHDVDPASPDPVESGSTPPNEYVVGVDAGFAYGADWGTQSGPSQIAAERVHVLQSGRDVRAMGLAIMEVPLDGNPAGDTILSCLGEGPIVTLPDAWTDGGEINHNDGTHGVVYWSLYRPSTFETLSGGIWLVTLGPAAWGGSGIWYGFTDDAEVGAAQALSQDGDEIWIKFLYSYQFLLPNDPDA